MSDIKSMPSLVVGGALFGLLKRLGLCDDDLGRWRRRIVVIVAIVWLPLLLLSLAEGLAVGGTTMPFLHDVDTAVRYLVALPLLIFAEVLVHRRFPQAMARFRERGLVNGAQAAEFDRAIASTRRWIEAPGVEWLLLAFVYIVGVGGIWRNVSALEIDTWYAIAEHGRLIPRWPGYWMGLVSVPLFQFLLLRWYYRIALWWILMWRLSRLNLSFQPLHPDKAGGLGFLAQFALAFAPLLMAEGSMAAGWIAGQIFFSGAHLLQFKLDLVAAVVVAVFFVLGPLLTFAPGLAEAKRLGLSAMGGLAMRYVGEFREKWLLPGQSAGESPLGSGDIQSLADLGNSYAGLQQMRIVPFGSQTVLKLAVAVLAPVAPLSLTMISAEELINRILELLL